MSSVGTIAGYGFREAVRRKVFAVVLLLTAAFLGLYWLANHYVFRDVAHIQPPAGSSRGRSQAPSCSGSRCSRRCFSGRCSRSS